MGLDIDMHKADIFLSIGPACRPAYYIRNHGLRQFAPPLDWQMDYSLETVLHLFRTNFRDFFAEIKEIEDRRNESREYRRVKDIRNNIISIHHYDKKDSLIDGQKKFISVMLKRYDKMDNALRQSDKIALVCNRPEELDVLENFLRNFSAIYTGKQILLINIRHCAAMKGITKNTHNISQHLCIHDWIFNDIYTGDDKERFWIGSQENWNKVFQEYNLTKKEDIEIVLEKIRENKRLLIYGAGESTRILLPLLRRYRIETDAVIVSDTGNNPDFLDGVIVKEASEKLVKDAVIIISVVDRKMRSMLGWKIRRWGGIPIIFDMKKAQFIQGGFIPRVSVIIPFYNCEKFLPEVIHDLKAQTVAEFEVFFVNDASWDASEKIVLEAQHQDGRIYYYKNSEKKGAAFSRNLGIEMSTAPYVLCLDADDRYEPDLLEQFLKSADAFDADVIIQERNDFYGFSTDTIRRQRKIFKDEEELFSKSCFQLCEQPEDFLIRCLNATCDRMVRRTLLEKYNIRFQNLKNSNDVYYIIMVTCLAERIAHTETMDCLYHRRIHSEDGRISNDRDPMCTYYAMKAIRDGMIKHGVWEKYYRYFWIYALDSLEKQLFGCKDKIRQKEVYGFIVEKGLHELGIDSDPLYNQIDGAYRQQYHRFFEERFENKCFAHSMVLEALCCLYGDRIDEFVSEHSNRKIAFWGMGRNTPVLMKAFGKAKGEIAWVIDNDMSKVGLHVEGVKVVPYENVYQEIEIVILNNRIYYHDIFTQVQKFNPTIVLYTWEEIIWSR